MYLETLQSAKRLWKYIATDIFVAARERGNSFVLMNRGEKDENEPWIANLFFILDERWIW